MPRLFDDMLVECFEVIWAQQLPGLATVESDVQKRLVTLALGQLRIAAPGPDWFADAARRTLVGGMFLEEATPGGNDARRVAPEYVHIRKVHEFGIVFQCLSQQFDPGTRHSDEDRLF
jgi:hypothetical protein